MQSRAVNVDEIRKVNVPLSDFKPLQHWLIPQPTTEEYKEMFKMKLKPGMVMLAGIVAPLFKLKDSKDNSYDPYEVKNYIQLSDVALDMQRNVLYRSQGFKIVQITYPSIPQPSLIEGLTEGDRVLVHFSHGEPMGETILNTAHSEDITENIFKHNNNQRGYLYNVLIVWIDEIYAQLP